MSKTHSPAKHHHGGHVRGLTVKDEVCFHDLQKQRIKEMEKRMQEDLRKKRKEWEKEVERMKDEFLKLLPADHEWGSEELLDDPMIAKREGSTDALNTEKMKTVFTDYPGVGKRFRLHFNLQGFERETVDVSVDIDRIILKAVKLEDDGDGNPQKKEYIRKIQKPPEVDSDKIKSILTEDGILIVEAMLPPSTLNIRKILGSPAHTLSRSDSQNRSMGSTSDVSSNEEIFGLPTVSGEPGERKMELLVNVGTAFDPRDISVSVIRSDRLIVNAKREERTSDRFSINKFYKEYELDERIRTTSIRSGLTSKGTLIIKALCKGFKKENKVEAVKEMAEEIATMATPCGVLDLTRFPPKPLPKT